jgi:hypothetical protein
MRQRRKSFCSSSDWLCYWSPYKGPRLHHLFLLVPTNEIVQQETNMIDLGAIYDLDFLLFLAIHFNHRNLELRQITQSNMITTHLMAFTGMAALPACYPNDFAIPYHAIVVF